MTVSPPPGYAALPPAPRAVRPPLTPRAKRGAAIAGAVGFVVLSIGYALVAFSLGIALLAAFIGLILRAARSSTSEWYSGLVRVLAGLDLRPFIAPLVLVGILGVALMAVAIVVSARVLSAHEVRRPVAVTWAGVGVAIVASWVVSGIGGIFTRVGLGGIDWNSSSGGSSLVTVLVVSGVLSVALNAVIGWLSWWWMAHALRPAALPGAVLTGSNA
ncbi:hypothetical protein F1C58_15440 [Glaciihabitans sp. INWT7]|uniref:hypothetical protein n=1 Tax=Glaciihabitans sp. INWT7 TaxID=2596912 RepID=UPI0016266201|nr:hypothetical protein [Glaciihabitans sp. INWT7]QNE48152.1 hypothetical protein F1C58_15440 [Glaciihabitans sp. INWT7]